MIDSFLAILDRAIQYSKSEEQNRRDLFVNVIEPIFIDLQPIVDDYFILFRDARDRIGTCRVADIPSAFSKIIENRERLLTERIKVRESCAILQDEITDRKVAAFAEKVVKFFYSAKYSPSAGKDLTIFCNAVKSGDFSKDHLLDYISDTVNNLEHSWGAIAQSYAALRLYCLAPKFVASKNSEYHQT